MPGFIAKRLVQMLIQKGKNPGNCKVLIMGITFKENVADIRNSKVAELAREIMQFSINVHITDPHASPNEVAKEYKLTLVDNISDDYDAVLVAVNHNEYKAYDMGYFKSICKTDPVIMDIKGVYPAPEGAGITYWRL